MIHVLLRLDLGDKTENIQLIQKGNLNVYPVQKQMRTALVQTAECPYESHVVQCRGVKEIVHTNIHMERLLGTRKRRIAEACMYICSSSGYSNQNSLPQKRSCGIVHYQGPHTCNLNQPQTKGRETKCGDWATIRHREAFQCTFFLDNLPCRRLNGTPTELNVDMPTIGLLNIRRDTRLPKPTSQPFRQWGGPKSRAHKRGPRSPCLVLHANLAAIHNTNVGDNATLFLAHGNGTRTGCRRSRNT